jgi:hypothetical protein
MKGRVGAITTIAGTIVAFIGYALYRASPIWGAGILGFGVAYVILGLIDLIQTSDRRVRD